MQRSLALALLAISSCCASATAAPFSKIFVFGDSLSDNGNILGFTTSAAVFDSEVVPRPKAPWYSKGRWTNGKDNTGSDSSDPKTKKSAYEGVWHEQLAPMLGLDPAKPYIDKIEENTNYAFGGATTAAGGVTGVAFMGGQLDGFFARSHAISDTQLFLAWAGGNDLRDAAKADGATKDTIKAAATTALNNMKTHLDRLADAGVKNIIWPNLPPMHLVPEFLTANDTIRGGLKEASEKFRDEQDDIVDAVRIEHINTEITIIDIHRLFERVVKNPASFGYTNHTQGIINVPDFSSKPFEPTANFTTQEDPDKYVFWDQLHPSARTHALIAAKVRGAIPEPASFALVMVGLFGGSLGRRHMKRPRGNCAAGSRV